MSMNIRLAGAVFLLGAMASGAVLAQSSDENSSRGGKSVQVPLKPQSNSGERGTVKLTPMGDKTKVEVSLRGEPKGIAQPAHIHEGTCAQLDPKPKYPLNNIVDGKSTTEVPAKLDELTGGSLAVNVHKSGDDIKTYVACGDLKSSQG
jgi:Cu/Zn superoxide dismutase